MFFSFFLFFVLVLKEKKRKKEKKDKKEKNMEIDEKVIEQEFGPFNVGTDDDDQTYTAQNFSYWREKQEIALSLLGTPGYPIEMPVFGYDIAAYKNDKGVHVTGAKRYVPCSYAAMLKYARRLAPMDRHVNEMVREGRPRHLYIDVDLKLCEWPKLKTLPEAERMPHVRTFVAGAVKEFWLCMRLVYERFKAAGVAGYDFEWDGIYETKLEADSVIKCSRHYVLHLPKRRMFADHDDIKGFVAAAFFLNLERYNNDMEINPLYYFNHEDKWAPVIDQSVFSRNRVWRMLAQVKIKHNKEEMCGWLRRPGEPDDPDVQYTDAEFLKNSPCFIARKPDGSPVDIVLLHAPHLNFPGRSPGRGFKFTPEQKKMLPFVPYATRDEWRPRAFSFLRGGDASNDTKDYSKKRAWHEIYGHDDDNNDDDSGSGSDNESKKAKPAAPGVSIGDIFNATSSALERQIGALCSAADYDKSGRGFIPTRSHWCPIKGSDHTSNHVAFVVFLDYPFPRIMYSCPDDICKTAKERTFLDPDKTLFEPVRVLLMEYARQQVITPKMLFPSLHVSKK
jgi:hypothetical protein